jgi:hypothetical protein
MTTAGTNDYKKQKQQHPLPPTTIKEYTNTDDYHINTNDAKKHNQQHPTATATTAAADEPLGDVASINTKPTTTATAAPTRNPSKAKKAQQHARAGEKRTPKHPHSQTQLTATKNAEANKSNRPSHVLKQPTHNPANNTENDQITRLLQNGEAFSSCKPH